jgi:hypothetical protein
LQAERFSAEVRIATPRLYIQRMAAMSSTQCAYSSCFRSPHL